MSPTANTTHAVSTSTGPAASSTTPAFQAKPKKPIKCPICDDQHRIGQCSTFTAYDCNKRNKVAKDKQLFSIVFFQATTTRIAPQRILVTEASYSVAPRFHDGFASHHYYYRLILDHLSHNV